MELVTVEHVRSAAAAIAGTVVRTPLLACPWAAERDAFWLKPENFQLTGSFKIRGAFHAVSSLPPGRRAAGVIAHSSGNHAQALAYAARAFGVPCVVVMPDVSLPVKIAATRALGAEVVLVPAAEREARAEDLAARHGYSLIPPYDHPAVIAGQGTVGLEIIEDRPRAGLVLVPVGGGGLASGVATAVKALRSAAAVVGVEPDQAADAAESLRAGRLVPWPVAMTGRTVADGLRTSLSARTFAHLNAYLDDIVTVSEEEILAAVAELARSARVIAEPSGAVAAAAYLYHRERLPPGEAVAVISGGNIEADLLIQVLGMPAAATRTRAP